VDARGEQERFVIEAHPSLVAALTHQFGDRGLAEELTQEALVRACDRWSSVRTLDSPIGWTFRVAVNLGRSTLRRRAAERRARVRLGDAPSVHHDPDVALRLTVHDALRALTDPQRQAVVLRHFLGLSAAETARVLATTEEAVRALTHRGVAALRASLPEATSSEVPDA
jgi:RNA polymerase sigma-70 factor (ECF subfamily)